MSSQSIRYTLQGGLVSKISEGTPLQLACCPSQLGFCGRIIYMVGICRAHITEMSKAMDTPASTAMQWPSHSQRYSTVGVSSGRGTLENESTGRPEHAVGRASPPLGRSLLRGSHADSTDSLASPEQGGRCKEYMLD